MTDETVLIALVQQYASRFGITFNSALLDDPAHKQQLIALIQQALAGTRGPITDADLQQ